ncbi:urease accessory protein UreF [Robertmurraya korlensis]|uniref:urease accessory protein UreF n=1 Tax=Robertmurraya korlensis TaxID=519977 RepID=UPI000826FD9C|nr:urease accessory protein UreF [Robertmurraya korlensis]
MINPIYSLLQLCDSNFPSGAFSHSFGIETYIQEGAIHDKTSFQHALVLYIRKQLVFSDGLACALSYEAIDNGENGSLVEIDHLLYCSSLAQETRVGTRRMGERMAKLCLELYPSSILGDYVKWMKEKKVYGHPAIVFAIVAYGLSVGKKTAVGSYLFSTVSSLVQNGVRGIPLGQTDGQKMVLEIQPVIEEAVNRMAHLSIDDLGAVSPGLEIAQMRHERLHVRLFMS